jgi:hypothetical protein
MEGWSVETKGCVTKGVGGGVVNSADVFCNPLDVKTLNKTGSDTTLRWVQSLGQSQVPCADSAVGGALTVPPADTANAGIKPRPRSEKRRRKPRCAGFPPLVVSSAQLPPPARSFDKHKDP